MTPGVIDFKETPNGIKIFFHSLVSWCKCEDLETQGNGQECAMDVACSVQLSGLWESRAGLSQELQLKNMHTHTNQPASFCQELALSASLYWAVTHVSRSYKRDRAHPTSNSFRLCLASQKGTRITWPLSPKQGEQNHLEDSHVRWGCWSKGNWFSRGYLPSPITQSLQESLRQTALPGALDCTIYQKSRSSPDASREECQIISNFLHKKRKGFPHTGSDDHPLGALGICRKRFNIEP